MLAKSYSGRGNEKWEITLTDELFPNRNYEQKEHEEEFQKMQL